MSNLLHSIRSIFTNKKREDSVSLFLDPASVNRIMEQKEMSKLGQASFETLVGHLESLKRAFSNLPDVKFHLKCARLRSFQEYGAFFFNRELFLSLEKFIVQCPVIYKNEKLFCAVVDETMYGETDPYNNQIYRYRINLPFHEPVSLVAETRRMVPWNEKDETVAICYVVRLITETKKEINIPFDSMVFLHYAGSKQMENLIEY